MQAQVFSLTLSPEQAQACLSALEREVESCVEADLRDRQIFGFGPVIHEDSARDRAYIQARKFAAESMLLAMQTAGVPYAAESLERARGAQERVWGRFKRELEEKALFARLDKDETLREALRQFSISLGAVKVGGTAKAKPALSGLEKDTLATLSKANDKIPGWAKEVPALASRALNLGFHLPTKAGTAVAMAGNILDRAFQEVASANKEVA